MEKSGDGAGLMTNSKKPRDLFAEVISFAALDAALDRALRGKRHRPESARFAADRERNLLFLSEQLRSHRWQPGKSRTFRIWDPKERTIVVPPFSDRVVHHALCAVLEPRIERRMIDHSYACRKGKGTVAAVVTAQRYVRRFQYVLCLDVEKHFPSIRHEPLLTQLRRVVCDPDILWLVSLILQHGSPPETPGKGLPIGQLTSQLWGNFALDPLDHHLKDNLGIAGYLRYMDDLRVFADDKKQLWVLVPEIDSVIAKMGLRLSIRATRLLPTSEGMPFLGLRIFPGVIRLQRRVAVRAARAIRRALALADSRPDTAFSTLNGICAHLGMANTLRFRRHVLFGKQHSHLKEKSSMPD